MKTFEQIFNMNKSIKVSYVEFRFEIESYEIEHFMYSASVFYDLAWNHFAEYLHPQMRLQGIRDDFEFYIAGYLRNSKINPKELGKLTSSLALFLERPIGTTIWPSKPLDKVIEAEWKPDGTGIYNPQSGKNSFPFIWEKN